MSMSTCLSLFFFLSLSLSLSLYTHIYTSFMIFSTDDIAKYHEYINSQGNDKTMHIKHIHKTYPYPQNIPAFFLSNFFWLRLQEPAVFSWAWMVARSSMKALRFEWKTPRNGAWRYQNSDTTDVSRKQQQTRVDTGRRLEICQQKSEIWMCFFATGTVSVRGGFHPGIPTDFTTDVRSPQG